MLPCSWCSFLKGDGDGLGISAAGLASPLFAACVLKIKCSFHTQQVYKQHCSSSARKALAFKSFKMLQREISITG